MTHFVVLEELSKEDFFVCGNCKSVFTYLPLFLDHKRQLCRKVPVAEKIPLIHEFTLSSQIKGVTTTPAPASNLRKLTVPEKIPINNEFDISSQLKRVTTTPAPTSNLRKLTVPEKIPIINEFAISSQLKGVNTTSSASNHRIESDIPVSYLNQKQSDICCKFCSKHFGKLKNLMVHLKTHNGKPYQCLVCGHCFSQNSHLQRHEMSHRVWPGGLSETTVKTTDVNAMSYFCTYCEKILSNYSQFRGHLKIHVSLKQFKCIQGDCVALFENLELLLAHVRIEHKEPLYSCHICLKSFTTLEDIATHQQNHIETTKPVKDTIKYKCAQCDACFKRKDKLNLHLSIENHKKKCIHCEKVFVSDKRLRLHLQTHRDNKPFHCDICGYSFHMKKYLASHMLRHGERQFVCNVCSFQFKRKDLLQRHMKAHLNRKKMKCPFAETLGCRIEFTRNDKLKLHIKNHTKKITNYVRKDKDQKELAAATMEIVIVPFSDTADTEPQQ